MSKTSKRGFHRYAPEARVKIVYITQNVTDADNKSK